MLAFGMKLERRTFLKRLKVFSETLKIFILENLIMAFCCLRNLGQQAVACNP